MNDGLELFNLIFFSLRCVVGCMYIHLRIYAHLIHKQLKYPSLLQGSCVSY